MKNWSYKSLFIIIAFLLIGIVVLSRFVFPKQKISAAWFNDGWRYRQYFPVSNTSGSDQSNFVVSINISTSTLATAGKIQSNCNDIRATDTNGNLLQHFVTQCNTTNTNVYVQIPVTPFSGTGVYIYYGNPSAPNIETSSIFTYFESYDTGTAQSTWTTTQLSVGITSGFANKGTSSLNFIAQGSSYKNLSQTFNTTNDWTNQYLEYEFFSDVAGSAPSWHTDPRNSGGSRMNSWNTFTIIPSTWTTFSQDLNTNTYKDDLKSILYFTASDNDSRNIFIDSFRIRKCTSTVTIGTPLTEEISPAPVAYWKFDEGIGTTAYDSTSNKINGVFGNGIASPTWADESNCLSGKCLQIGTSNAYVNLGTNSTLDSNHDFTISVWIKPNTILTGWNRIYFGQSNDIGFGYQDAGSGTAKLRLTKTNTQDAGLSTNTINQNQWSYVTVTFNNTSKDVSYYINGKFSNTVNFNQTFINSNKYIGCNFGQSMLGYLDELKIYQYARTAAQIKSDYATGLAHTSSSKGTSASLSSNNKNGDFLSNGLIGYWKLDENVGTSTLDSSGNNNTGTLSGTSWISGKFGIGVSFNGVNNYIDAGTSPSISVTNNITISAWVKPNSFTSFPYILSKTDGTNDSYGLIVSSSGAPRLLIWSGNNVKGDDYTGGNTLTIGTWNHVVATYDGSKINNYLNGNLIKSIVFTGNIDNEPANLNFGRRGNLSQYLDGNLDEVRIYNRALSSSEVSMLYNWAPGPVGYWDFNDNTGSVVNDKSSYGNLGSWNGTLGSQWISGKYGSAGKFNGTDNYVNVGKANSLNNTTTLTLSAWIKPSILSSNFRTGIITRRPGLNFDLAGSLEACGAGKIEVMQDGGANVCGTTTLPLNTWSYVTAILSGTNVNLYVNGILNGSGSLTWTWDSAVDIHIGDIANISSYLFNGQIDEAKIYNYVRTQKQIIEDMNAGHPAVSNNSMPGYWKFDEGFGTQTNNTGSGGPTLNATFGTGNSAPVWTNDGKFNKALIFNNISSPYGLANFDMGVLKQGNETNAFTLSAWVKPNGVQNGNERVIAGRSGCHGGLIANANNTFSFNIAATDCWTSGIILSSGVIPNWNNWHHLVGVYDNRIMKIYIDGVLKNTGTFNATFNPYGNAFYFGSIGTYSFDGIIDEVKIYNSALTPDEIKLDYNRGAATQLGSLSAGTGNSAPLTASSQQYCVPGDSSICSAPVAEWNFEENNGILVSDSSGNNNNGTFGTGNSGPSWTVGKNSSGSSLKFNGGQYISVTDNASLKPTTTLTAEAWFNSTNKALTAQRILSKTESSGYQLSLNENSSCPSNTLCFIINIAGTYYSATYASSNLSNNTWYHAAGTYDGTTVKLFLNGINVGTTSIVSNTITQGPYNLCIGSETDAGSCTSGFFNGKIDQVKIFNYARTPAQIAFDYNRGSPIGWWKLDECQGSVAHDSSGIGNTGSISIGGAGSQISLGTCSVGTSAAWTNGKTGKYNSSLNFDGIDDRVNLPNDINLGTQEFTVSAWVNHHSFGTTGSSRPYVSDWNTWSVGSQKGFILRAYDTQSTPSFWLADGTNYFTVTSSKSLTLNTWYHVVGVFKANSIYKIYVNGVETGSAAAPTQYIKENTSPIYIGYGGINAGYMDGQIDDTRIYNYALTSTQIKTLYNNGAISFSN